MEEQTNEFKGKIKRKTTDITKVLTIVLVKNMNQ